MPCKRIKIRPADQPWSNTYIHGYYQFHKKINSDYSSLLNNVNSLPEIHTKYLNKRSNPSQLSPDALTAPPVKQRGRLDSLPLMGQGYLRITHSTTATPVQETSDLKKKKCENCVYETVSTQELGSHIETNHRPTCSRCDKTFKTTADLSTHIDTEHNISCDCCSETFTDKKKTRNIQLANTGHLKR